MPLLDSYLNSIKQTLRRLVEETPILRDYYYYYWLFPRNPNLYRYVFFSFAEALAAVPSDALSGYNYREFYDSRLTDLTEVEKLKPIDYPVLVWLRQAFLDSSRVFDLGGTTGYGYYAYRKYIAFPENIHWTVCEVPAIAEVGKELMDLIPSPGLSYTTSLSEAQGEIFYSCGMLQYFEESLAEMLSQWQVKPRHLVINHIPLYEGENYVTLQRPLLVRSPSNFVSYLPFKIQNRTRFIDDLLTLGYELVDSWQQDRQCFIPFHPERFVDAFHGFYFRYRAALCG
jgi:putative methyltransferase (TIGR04325 family)